MTTPISAERSSTVGHGLRSASRCAQHQRPALQALVVLLGMFLALLAAGCGNTPPDESIGHTEQAVLCSAGCGPCEKCSGVNCVADTAKNNLACPDDGLGCTNDLCSAGVCTHPVRAAGSVCRAAAGVCDVQETCNGVAGACPADAFATSATVCRAAVAGGCDVAETCTGTGAACPADVVMPAATVCRASTGACDPGETCTGASNACPTASFSPAGTACPDDGNPCTTDVCNGASATCQHPAGNAGTVCRAGTGECDADELCTGASTACPAAAFKAAGTACTDDGNPCTTDVCNGASATCTHPVGNAGAVCRAATGVCDVAETCTGASSSCPSNALAPNTTVCRAAAGPCDVAESCTGASVNCPADTLRSAGFVCRAAVAGGCDVAEACTGAAAACPGDVVAASGTSCRASTGECDPGETCTGASNTCPSDSKSPNGTACTDDGNPCTADTCNGSAATCQHPVGNAGAVCRASAGPCDLVETCTGASTTCPSNAYAPTTTVCRAAVGTCDIAEKCGGSSAACPTDVVVASGTTCRASAGVCDLTEKCTGSSGTCPADGVQPSGTVCRAAVAGGCDFVELCDGASTSCPTDLVATAGAACADDSDICTVDQCSGVSNSCGHNAVGGCAHGLTATYYDNMDFTGATVTRVDPKIDFDWGNGSPDPAIGVDSYTVRWTGLVLPLYTGTYTFETESDDGARLWVNGVLLVDKFIDQGPTKYSGTIDLVANQSYDIKMDYYENGGGATARLRWSGPSTAYGVIPSARLLADGDAGNSGFDLVSQGNSGSGDPYTIWRLSDVAGTAPVNASAESANNWGLGNAVMMVPAFSPDGTKLVFIDGDEAGGAGWRKGLSVWDFNQSGKKFSNRRSLRDTWPFGDVMKWPVFEPDSRTVIFQTSTPTELCTTCDGKTGQRYGNMAPTNYYGTPGNLWSIDSAGTSNAVALAQLNNGERAADAAKSYQPTALPVSAGGYRWVVFTSTRPYGNTLNPPGTDTSCLASQLWVSAIDDTTSANTDRSHPSFWLPNQNVGGPLANSYVNERAYWVLQACRPPGSTAASVCSTNEDCCGAAASPPTAACRIDQPASTPPTRHCVAINASTCALNGGSCAADGDCCGFPTSHCVAGACKPPPPVGFYNEGFLSRTYEGTCPAGTSPIWRFFDWKTVTPSNSQIVILARTAETLAELTTAPDVTVATIQGVPNVQWTGVDVGPLLPRKASMHFLQITIDLKPSTDRNDAPVLSDWRQSFSCTPSE